MLARTGLARSSLCMSQTRNVRQPNGVGRTGSESNLLAKGIKLLQVPRWNPKAQAQAGRQAGRQQCLMYMQLAAHIVAHMIQPKSPHVISAHNCANSEQFPDHPNPKRIYVEISFCTETRGNVLLNVLFRCFQVRVPVVW